MGSKIVAKFPALMLWTDSWVADTHHLSRVERGTYFDLLVLMWRSPDCRVPNDDLWLGKRMGMTPAEVQSELRPITAEFCQSDGNFLFQKRLRKEFLVTQKKSAAQSVRIKAFWDKKKKNDEMYSTKYSPVEQPQPQPQPEHLKKERKKDTEVRTSAAEAAPLAPIYTDSVHELWGEGIPILEALGVSGGKARPNVGRWLKQTENDAQQVLGAIQRARDHRVIEPVAWITRALQTGGSNGTAGYGGRKDDRNLSQIGLDHLFASRDQN